MGAVSFTQQGFSGGMNLVDLGTKVQPNEYITGINLRSRFGYLEPVRAPIDLTGDLPTDSKSIQGLYAFGEILVCFIGGLAYYLNAGDENSQWTQIANFQMSETATRIYAQGVPAAGLVYLRKNNSSDSPDAGVILDPASTTGSSEVALVCQDGENQPWLIFSNGTARVSQDYDSWSTDNREYVPIGRQMCFSEGRLYIVSAGGNKIYRSVSGRPLDFVIAIDTNGAAVADADVLSIAVDNNEIKLLAPSNDENGSLIVITAYSARAIIPNKDKLLYGEPTFNTPFLFSAGTINQFCWADLLGDFAFIDREGLKSFNSVQQLKFEGNNSIFSLGIAKLFQGVVQDDNACVGSYDNYTFFSVNTVNSPATVIVYDNVKRIFCSIDFLSSKVIKQFATTYSASRQRFFGATVDSILELYSPESEEPLTATAFSREFNSINVDGGGLGGYNVKASEVLLLFEDGLESGECVLDVLVNNTRENVQDAENNVTTINFDEGAIYYPILYPVMFSSNTSVFPVNIKPKNSKEGQKISCVITWTGGAKLTEFILRGESKKSLSSIQQQSRT